MITAKLPATLSDLINTDKDEDGNPKLNEFLQALSQAEIKSAMLVLILNEARIFKSYLSKGQLSEYNTLVGMTKISSWVDIIDLEAFIESKQTAPENQSSGYQDGIPTE